MPQKRQIAWDWNSKNQSSIPSEKKKKVTKVPQPAERFHCLECLELALQGKREERFTTLCRADQSSVKRHKERWHKVGGGFGKCTVVPQTALEVQEIRSKYKQPKRPNNAPPATSPASLKMPEIHEQDRSCSIAACGDNEIIAIPSSDTTEEVLKTSFDTSKSPLESDATLESAMILPHAAKKQTTLLCFTEPGRSSDGDAVANLEGVMEAIGGLSLKVDNIEKQHNSLIQLAFENDDTRKTVIALQKAENVLQLAKVTQLIEFFYDEPSQTAILRCSPCYKLHLASKPTLGRLTPFQASRIINSSGSGTLTSGILLKQETTRQLIEGHNATWYRQKNVLINHLCRIGEGSKMHRKAMEEYNKEIKLMEKKTTAAKNIFRAAIINLKLGSAASSHEKLISFLGCCGVNVGKIRHGRNLFNDILYCLEKAVNVRINAWLKTPLPSTMLPPHFWATVDKATPSRKTNQAILVVARNSSGVPCPIPIEAPNVYTDFRTASYESLAELLVKAIEDNLSHEVLSRFCGVAADGPYQATRFRKKLLEILNIADNGNQLPFPVTWDAAHALNLGVVDVKDSQTESGNHFKRFVKRCIVFNNILSNGKGFAFLQLVDSSARRPVAYATQRFTSSAYEQWLKIEKSFSSFWQAFELLHPHREEEEELQYMITGYDFVSDLLAFLDVLKPVVDLMFRVQSLDTPVWKLKLWWPKVKAKLAKAASGDLEAYPRLKNVIDSLKPDGVFNDVTLLQGWLVVNDAGPGAGRDGSRFTWKMREPHDVKRDRETLALDLLSSLDRRVAAVVRDGAFSVLEVFDAARLVNLHCGSLFGDDVKLVVSEGDYDIYSENECRQVLETSVNLPHIEESGINFDPRLAHRYMNSIKEAVMLGVWKSPCVEWFILEDNVPLNIGNSNLVSFLSVPSNDLDSLFHMKFDDGKEYNVGLHEQNFYASFYSNPEIYSIAKAPSCALLDIVLAKGGPEAIAESFYNSMRAQQQSGGQANDNLARRTKINWCLPSLKHCEGIIQESVQT